MEELRARAGVLLAVSSLGASLLGQQALQSPGPRELGIIALLAFTISIAADVFILLPKRNLVFMQKAPVLYEELFAHREDMSEVYRRLTYALDRFWRASDAKIQRLRRAFTIAALALVIEILALAGLLGGNILSS